jgi:hypothetical protein
MSKARDLANAGTALGAVTATELGYVDGVTSAIQTQIDTKAPSSTAVTLTGTQTLTNKTLTSPAIASPTVTGTLTAGGSAGTAGQVLTSTGTGVQYVTPVSGSTNITLKRARDTSTATFTSIATDGSTNWVIVGSSGVLYSSTDSGSTWTSRTSGFGSVTIRKVFYGNGIFIAIGSSGLLTTSTDTITWTARTSGFGTQTINGIDYVNGYYIATGQDAPNSKAGVSTSTDAINWTARTTPAGSTYSARCATYGNGYYLVAGDGNTTSAMYSTDLATWTAITATNGYNFIKAFYENNQFILIADTPSGENWYTGNNPTTGWSYFYPTFVTSSSPGNSTVDSYAGNIYMYSINTPQLTIAKAKLQIAGGTGLSFTEIYKPLTKDLPTTLAAIVSKGDGTFGLLNSQGYVWFTS